MGRPSELTEEISKHIITSLRLGMTREMAAKAAGFTASTLYQWLSKGRDGDPKYIKFAESVESADAEFVRNNLATITRASTKQWQAAAWMLERRLPSQFARQVKVTLEAEQNEFLDRLEAALPPDVYARILDIVTNADRGTATSEADAAASIADEGTDPEGTPDAG